MPPRATPGHALRARFPARQALQKCALPAPDRTAAVASILGTAVTWCSSGEFRRLSAARRLSALPLPCGEVEIAKRFRVRGSRSIEKIRQLPLPRNLLRKFDPSTQGRGRPRRYPDRAARVRKERTAF